MIKNSSSQDKGSPSRQSPPQEAGVLQKQIAYALFAYEQIMQNYTPDDKTVVLEAGEKFEQDILGIISTAVDGMIPEPRVLPDINQNWNEHWMHIAGGVTEYNAAIAEFQRRRKEVGL